MPGLTFKQAVEATEEIATGFRSGLTAFGKYSNKIEVRDTTLIQGSVEIDECTKHLYPNDNRWDYVFAYNSEVYFIEVHSANSGEVRTVILKLKWLMQWLNEKAPEIKKMKVKNRTPYYWVQSKNFQIPKNSPQYRMAAKVGLMPIPKLILY
ncbi:MAG: hypothetical protein Q8R96_14070 [Bacteroidota bacterium]|nr:hypothetical protein [Bacteroidota bacterium]